MHLRNKQDKQKNMKTKEKEVGVQNNVDQYQFPPKDIHNIGKRLGYEN